MTVQAFLNESYTAYHAVENTEKLLKEAGFERLRLGEEWRLTVGGKYYVAKNGSSLIAFRVGRNKAFQIAVSHTDSPALKVKGNQTLASEGCVRLNVEKYGGGILRSFLDRQLKIAGRIVVKSESGVTVKNVVSPFNVVVPDLAIHQNTSVNEGGALNPQTDMLPLLGLNNADLYAQLSGGEEVLDADLFVVPANGAFAAGVNGELLCSPRIDNLTSVYACVNGLIACAPQGVAVAACFDNEELGSGTRQGGGSDFLAQTLQAVAEGLGWKNCDLVSAKENGFLLSVDNGHAVHPAHPEKSDPTGRVYMNGGIVIKHHPHYATDGLTSAIFKRILDKNGVPYQDFYNRSDGHCGSTIGLIAAANLSVKACDIGLAQLAMHSACETVALKDVECMERGVTCFFSANLREEGNDVLIG